jgi:hypothetical protein
MKSRKNFKSFFTGPEGWDSAGQVRAGQVQTNEFRVEEGRMLVRELRLQLAGRPTTVEAELAGRAQKLSFSSDGSNLRISFTEPMLAKATETLRVRCSF